MSLAIDGPIQNRIDVGAALTTTPEIEATSTVQLSAASFNITEGPSSVTFAVTRTGDTSAAATVNYATSDSAGSNNCNAANGIASSRCDYETMMGTLHFAAGETSKTI